MRIFRDIANFTVQENVSIVDALSLLNETKNRILFVVNSFGVVLASFSDGDFRRWVVSTKDLDLQKRILSIANREFVSIHEDSPEREIAALFSEKIEVVPLVDDEFRIRAVAKPEKKLFSIGRFNVSKDSRVLVIAEIGNNHNGNLAEAKKLVDSAIASGADCVKFQMRDLNSLYVNGGSNADASADLGTQYVLDLLSRFQLCDADFEEIFSYCQERDIVALCTPFDTVSADKLEKLGVSAYKVASADLTNHELLLHLVAKRRSILLSTGMSSEQEIIATIELLKDHNANFVLLHCNSTYPCPVEDVNLSYISRLQNLVGGVVGYSGHERGIEISLAAVALGAKVIERHFTHDKTMEGNDHKVSLLPGEFAEMVAGIRTIEKGIGKDAARRVSQGEMINREALAKSVVAATPISKGTVISDSMLAIRSPGKGLPPYYKRDLLGRIATRDFAVNDFFYLSDIKRNSKSPRNYTFKNRFGLPVRYHDLDTIIKNTNLDFVEFHLSYKDLELNPEEFIRNAKYDMDCIVHAPELFAGDHLLDLCSEDEAYRGRSIEDLQQVFAVVNKLKMPFNNKGEKILVVTNVGGFSNADFIGADERQRKYEILRDSLGQLDMTGVELIPQTMPPYPWHFGGQQFHNLFVSVPEIVEFCEQNSMRICLDISHTALACNHLEVDLYDALISLAPYTAHLHIADASGTRQEGLQIGEGDIDFESVYRIMGEAMPRAYWLPEIWQGHKNQGEGFWLALERLESCQ